MCLFCVSTCEGKGPLRKVNYSCTSAAFSFSQFPFYFFSSHRHSSFPSLSILSSNLNVLRLVPSIFSFHPLLLSFFAFPFLAPYISSLPSVPPVLLAVLSRVPFSLLFYILSPSHACIFPTPHPLPSSSISLGSPILPVSLISLVPPLPFSFSLSPRT